ncbi:MAG: glycosyltransferase family 4 protein [Opitutus sp.]|nr:glycosyltransferase family 4 protein [Opitutus sp.]
MAVDAHAPRLAIVLSHPTQYYSPWFRWLAQHTALRLHVFYLWEAGSTATRDPHFDTTFAWDVDLLSGYSYEFVPNTSSRAGTYHFDGLRNPTLTRRLAAWKPDAILLFGYAYESNLRVLFWARRHGVPVIFRGDSHLLGRARPPLRTRLLLRFLFRQFAAFAYVGAVNRDYFTTFGVPSRKLFFAPHAVDDSRFNLTDERTINEATRLRHELGLGRETRVILFAGKWVPAKQPRELLEAFLALDYPKSALVFVGDGEERDALKTLAARAPAGRVHFLPFANQSEMPSRYLMADVFALPSRGLYETWGLAINEAMHLGRPCLVSDRVGCQRDLVTEGKTGWVFSVDDPDGLKEALARACSADLEAMKPAVASRISGYTYSESTAGLLDAFGSVHRR